MELKPCPRYGTGELRMTDYISRDDVRSFIANAFSDNRFATNYDYAILIDKVDEIPTADVQPVKHGHWYDNTYRYVGELDAYFIQACCSCCNRYSDRLDQYTKIMSNETCSHCGARMDGDNHEVYTD